MQDHFPLSCRHVFFESWFFYLPSVLGVFPPLFRDTRSSYVAGAGGPSPVLDLPYLLFPQSLDTRRPSSCPSTFLPGSRPCRERACLRSTEKYSVFFSPFTPSRLSRIPGLGFSTTTSFFSVANLFPFPFPGVFQFRGSAPSWAKPTVVLLPVFPIFPCISEGSLASFHVLPLVSRSPFLFLPSDLTVPLQGIGPLVPASFPPVLTPSTTFFDLFIPQLPGAVSALFCVLSPPLFCFFFHGNLFFQRR